MLPPPIDFANAGRRRSEKLQATSPSWSIRLGNWLKRETTIEARETIFEAWVLAFLAMCTSHLVLLLQGISDKLSSAVVDLLRVRSGKNPRKAAVARGTPADVRALTYQYLVLLRKLKPLRPSTATLRSLPMGPELPTRELLQATGRFCQAKSLPKPDLSTLLQLLAAGRLVNNRYNSIYVLSGNLLPTPSHTELQSHLSVKNRASDLAASQSFSFDLSRYPGRHSVSVRSVQRLFQFQRPGGGIGHTVLSGWRAVLFFLVIPQGFCISFILFHLSTFFLSLRMGLNISTKHMTSTGLFPAHKRVPEGHILAHVRICI